jgi:nucleoside 2-deoxyribosyltransferase
MKVIYPPHEVDIKEGVSVFLAGSIEMDRAAPWQNMVIHALTETRLTILNPRRKEWDASWKQEATNEPFREQVNWELAGIEESDIVAFYFDPATKSPVTMLELGLAIGLQKKIVLACPQGFWRKGNIDITATRNRISVLPSLEALIVALHSLVSNHKEQS